MLTTVLALALVCADAASDEAEAALALAAAGVKKLTPPGPPNPAPPAPPPPPAVPEKSPLETAITLAQMAGKRVALFRGCPPRDILGCVCVRDDAVSGPPGVLVFRPGDARCDVWPPDASPESVAAYYQPPPAPPPPAYFVPPFYGLPSGDCPNGQCRPRY